MIHGLIVLDGFGQAKDQSKSAIDRANTPYLDALYEKYPHTLISPSGEDVGLPGGQMGNSEVGHLNMGAGRIVYQELTRIGKEIREGDFFTNPALLQAIAHAKQTRGKLHLLGLLSDGGVHSHVEHLLALIRLAKSQGLSNVYLHCFLDGRDVPPTSGKGYLEELMAHLHNLQFGKIVTVIGRYYAMDRDNRWDRTQIAYDAMTLGLGERSEDLLTTLEQRYAHKQTDEFIKPIILSEDDIGDGDSMIFFNFRPDRARQLTRAFTQREFASFPRNKFPLVEFVSLTQYDRLFAHVNVAYAPQELKNTCGQYLAALGKKQLRIAETEKYAHVTFFFNGGVEQPNAGEDRILVDSPKVATYDLQPEMSAMQVAQRAAEAMENYDVMILNFANADMVGHSGNMQAAVLAIEAVDRALEIVVEKIIALGGSCIITADHGNAEAMEDDFGNPVTAHTTNPVPMIVVNAGAKALEQGGRLCDLAPTLLDMMNLPPPPEMTGHSLLVR